MVNYLLPQSALTINASPVINALNRMQQQRNADRQFQQDQDRYAQETAWRQSQANKAEANSLRNYNLQEKQFDFERQKASQGPARPWWAGSQGQIDPAMARYRELGKPTTNVNVGAGETAYDKELGEQNAKLFTESQKSGATAQRDLNNLNVMRNAMADPNLYSGTAGNTVQTLKKAAQTLFGVPVAGVSSGEVVQNLAKGIAVSLKDNLPGPMSDSDRRFLVEMAPGLTNSPDGNRKIIALGMLQKEYQIARSKAAREYARQNRGRIDAGVYQRLGEVDQIFAQQFSGLIAQLRASGEEPPRSPTVGVPIGALRSQYGLELKTDSE
jgi:hypothetical protein